MKIKWVLLITGFIFCLQSVSFAEISPEKKELIDRLMAQTGQSSIDVGKQFSTLFIRQMTMQLKQTNPNINPRAFTIIQEEVNNVIDQEVIKNKRFTLMLYPVYDKYFTAEDLRQMIKFNETEVGRKIIKVMPMVTQESMMVGQQFGQSIAPEFQKRIMDRFRQEGIH